MKDKEMILTLALLVGSIIGYLTKMLVGYKVVGEISKDINKFEPKENKVTIFDIILLSIICFLGGMLFQHILGI